LLAAAAASSGVLAAHRLGHLAIPGCGVDSPCDRAASSSWGRIPILDWPLSHVGAASFGGLLVAWLLTRGRLTPSLRWLVRAGAAVSLLLIGVMLVEELLCPYCLATHVANVLFAALVELGPRADAHPSARPLAGAVLGCAAISTVLVLAESEARARNEEELAGSIRAIQAAGVASGAAEPEVSAAGSDSTSSVAGPANPKGFTGRYRLGPPRARIRIVMITDYGCPDCRNFEAQAMELARRPDVSLSIKHFPFCTDCNPTPGVRNLHPNSCWAARAAEAAGLLQGEAAFWKMHRWLFEHRGAFTDAELEAGLRELGFERDPFLAAMRSTETLQRVQADIREAVGLGLQATPMMFVNGVELRGWNADPLALRRGVEAAAAEPLSRGPEEDRPPSAAERNRQEAERILEDWRRASVLALPGREQPWTDVPGTASVRVTLFGDLLESGTAAADRVVRDALAARGDVRYEFRYFPLDQSCNSTLPRTIFPLACSAARAAEAAGVLGGIDAYWRMHVWITEHQREFSEATLRAAAPSLGLDPAELLAQMNRPEVARVVAGDAAAGQRIGIPEIPRVFVDGRLLARWSLPEQSILERVLEEASRRK